MLLTVWTFCAFLATLLLEHCPLYAQLFSIGELMEMSIISDNKDQFTLAFYTRLTFWMVTETGFFSPGK